MSNLPELCSQLRMRSDGRVPVVNSRDVADKFGKDHRNVLRDIRSLLQERSELSAHGWFREASYVSEQGKEQPSFDLTRDGFTLLAMGWTGPKALAFKIQYIAAFNEMEALLKARPDIVTGEQFLAAIREIVSPLAVRLADQDKSIIRVEEKVDQLGEKVERIDQHLSKGKRAKLRKFEPQYVYIAWRYYGGKCPVSGVQILDENRNLIRGVAEIDHFYDTDTLSIWNGWVVAKQVNRDLGKGKIPRHSVEPHFKGFQEKLKTMLGTNVVDFPKPSMPTLFG
jgi:Rha family phage regulatory protein